MFLLNNISHAQRSIHTLRISSAEFSKLFATKLKTLSSEAVAWVGKLVTNILMNRKVAAVLQKGRYVINAQLSQGVFGITYRAVDTDSGRPVVIKTLAESLRYHPDFARFKQQLRAYARRLTSCEHPHLVRVLDCFEVEEWPQATAGRTEKSSRLSAKAVATSCFLVMEYIPGQTLARCLQNAAQLPEAKALKYIRQVGNALKLVHQAGLLHRDIKPHNIIQRQNTDEVVLVDFGIASELTLGARQTQATLSSAEYAPLEEYLPQAVHTPATDIYALAATLYCLLTGQAPVPAPLRNLIPLPNLRQFQPDLNSAVEQAILRGLEIEAADRPQTVAEWLALLPDNRPQLIPQEPPNCESRSGETPPDVSPLGEVPAPQPAFPEKPTKEQTANLNATPNLLGRAKKSKTQNPLYPLYAFTLRKLPQQRLPKALVITSVIAGSAGAGFGFALRFNQVLSPGSSLLRTDQSFPARGNWPVLDTPTSSPDTPVAPLMPESNRKSIRLP